MTSKQDSSNGPILLHRYTLEKHGSHDQKTHGRKGGGGGGVSSAISAKEMARIEGHEMDLRGLVDSVQALARQDSQYKSSAKKTMMAMNNVLGAQNASDRETAARKLRMAVNNLDKVSNDLENPGTIEYASDAFAIKNQIKATADGL